MGDLWLMLTDPRLTRYYQRVRQSMADAEREARTCPTCGRTYDDVSGALGCMTTHIIIASDMYEEAEDLIRSIEDPK